MRILWVLLSADYLRFYDSTIIELTRRGHEIRLAVSETNTAENIKRSKISTLAAQSSLVKDVGEIVQSKSRLARLATGLRGTIDYLRFLHPDYRQCHSLRVRMKYKALPKWLHGLDRIRSMDEIWLNRIIGVLQWLERCLPNNQEAIRFIKEHAPDAVLVTPLVKAACSQVDIVKAAQSLGIPLGVAIASWDNLTNKGLMRVTPDRVFVWNEKQRDEAQRYHGVDKDIVIATGAPAFDKWFSAKPTLSRQDFCNKVGLPDDKTIITFMGSSSFIVDYDSEIRFVANWIRKLGHSTLPGLQDVCFLIRPHPYSCQFWRDADFSMFPDVSIWPRETPEFLNEDDQATFFDTLYHCSAVVGINTSAMIEAAILGRPVHTILIDEFSRGQHQTIHFRYLLKENGGPVVVANDLDAHCHQLAHSLKYADDESPLLKKFCHDFIRPHGLEKNCSTILADELEKLGSGHCQTANLSDSIVNVN